jgi:sporulation protein YlmC with PRC-barrel domain
MIFRIILPVAVAVALITSAQSQQLPVPPAQPSTTTEIATGGAPILTSIPAAMITISIFYKQNLYDTMDRKIGEIADVLVDKEGNIGVFIVSVGGFLGIASKDVAVPFKAIEASQKNGTWYLTMNATMDALKGAPGYKYDKLTATWVPG